MVRIESLFLGFPGILERGFLGWSSCYLLQLQKGKYKNILFDTSGFNERHVLFKRLADKGIAPSDIDAVILSHLHFDHAANWLFFPNATVFVSKKEIEYAKTVTDFALLDFCAEHLEKRGNVTYVKEGDMISGMEIIETPGHTEGSLSLKIGEQFLVSDAIKNRNELTLGAIGNTWNKEIADQSIKKIIERATIIYPGHDVPHKKENGSWKAMYEYEEKLYIAENLLDNNVFLKKEVL